MAIIKMILGFHLAIYRKISMLLFRQLLIRPRQHLRTAWPPQSLSCSTSPKSPRRSPPATGRSRTPKPPRREAPVRKQPRKDPLVRKQHRKDPPVDARRLLRQRALARRTFSCMVAYSQLCVLCMSLIYMCFSMPSQPMQLCRSCRTRDLLLIRRMSFFDRRKQTWKNSWPRSTVSWVLRLGSERKPSRSLSMYRTPRPEKPRA